MIEDVQHMDPDTGELFPDSISSCAIRSEQSARAASVIAEFGVGNDKLEKAIFAALEEIKPVIEATSDGHHNNKYAKLSKLLGDIVPVLRRHEIRIRQGAERSFMLDEGGGVKGRLVPVYTDLIHVPSGQRDRTIVEMPVTRLDPQAMSSALTYGKRISLLGSLGLSADVLDDDGERATAPKITDATPESPDLKALKKEMDAFKGAGDLAEWAREPKQEKRFSRLSEADLALARAYYKKRGQDILNAPDDDAPPAKGKSK